MLETHKDLEPRIRGAKAETKPDISYAENAKAELIDNQQITEVINTYQKLNNTLNTAKVLNLTYQEVNKILIESKLKRIRKPNRKFKLDFKKTYFESIDTEHKAYFLGLLHADGSLIENRGTLRLSLSLAAKDKELVHKLCMALGLPLTKVSTVLPPTGEEQVRLTVHGIEFLTPLVNLKNYRVLDIVPSHLVHHFIRGIFDGDGSIYSHSSKKGRYHYYYASFIGYDWMMEFIKKNLNGKLKLRKIKSAGISRHEIFSKADMYSLYDYMYRDATIFLNRKHAKFLDMKYIDSVSQRLNDKLPTLNKEGDDIV